MQLNYYAKLMPDVFSEPSISLASWPPMTPGSNFSCTLTPYIVLLILPNPFLIPLSSSHSVPSPILPFLSGTSLTVHTLFLPVRCSYLFRMFLKLFPQHDRTFLFLFYQPYFDFTRFG